MDTDETKGMEVKRQARKRKKTNQGEPSNAKRGEEKDYKQNECGVQELFVDQQRSLVQNIASSFAADERTTNATAMEGTVANVGDNMQCDVDKRGEAERADGAEKNMSNETADKDSVCDNSFIENRFGCSSGENMIKFCEQVVAIAKSNDDHGRASSENEDTEGDIRAVAGNEEYVFPTPEEMEKDIVPAVGMEFPTLEDASRFVNVYAQKNGFVMIKGRNYKHRKISFQCNKCRKREGSFSGTRKRKRNVVEGTNFQMNVFAKLEDAKWHVVSLFLEHNHSLVSSPSLARFFLGYRHMNEAEIMLLKLLQEHRVKPRLIMSIFRKLRGGKYGNITFDVKNLDNLKQEGRLKKKKNTDIEWTLRYIEKLQIESPRFCYKMQTDSDNTVRSIFWTDTRSRMNYKLFGEIISFDTTYSTNKYNMPFAPIVGLNGHGKTIVFGWALLQNETADTFSWLFETFVEVMQGKKPGIVLTDQDSVMKVAVPRVFPEALHRFCIWHIMKNVKDNMGGYMALREGMEKDMIKAIMQSIIIEEFEERWNNFLIKYDCAEHDHIKRMWEARSKFVPAYFRGLFCPFIRSTGRTESFNSNFKDYIKRKDTIEAFMRQYELFQGNMIEIENQDRFVSNDKRPVYWSRQLIERHAAKIYTRGIYHKFLTELVNAIAFPVIEIDKDKTYELKRNFSYEKAEFSRKIFRVHVDRTTSEFKCFCGKFERDGVLCCHILRLFTQFDINEIPERYIMKRWTIEFREKELQKFKKDLFELTGTDQSETTVRYAILMSRVGDACSDIINDQELSKELMEAVQKVHAKYLQGKKQPEEEVQSESSVAPKDLILPRKEAAKEDSSIAPKDPILPRKQATKEDSCVPLKDLPILPSKSVNKGDRLNSQSEKNSKRKRGSRKKNNEQREG